MPRARAYWATAPFAGEIRSSEVRPPGPDEVTVRTLFSGISRGTESLVAAGRIPAAGHERMRCPFQRGAFPFPVCYGYAAVGEVVEGVPERIGDEVFCLHPHQDLFTVPATAAFTLPPAVPAGRAVLAANMETALNGLWDGRIMAGDRVTVLGAGTVGLLTAWLASRLPGSEVGIHDIDAGRRAAIEALGLEPGPLDKSDVVVDCTGDPGALTTALHHVADEGLILLAGWHGDKETTLPLGGRFFSGRLVLESSQVGSVPPARAARWSPARRLAKALELLADDRLDALIDGECAFGELPHVLPALAAGRLRALCRRVRYDRR
ncbi:MAG: dehydrogenase [Geminicoccaceae bacterium]|nr:dehydrogenase [Geminicoccaceae bacterium]